MANTQETPDTQREEFVQGVGIPLGTYRAKWANIRFSRFEPGWSQSANAFAESMIGCYVSTLRLDGTVDTKAIAEHVADGTPVSGDEEQYLHAFLGPAKFAKEFVEYWAARLPRRKMNEFAEDTSVLIDVLKAGAKVMAGLTSGPPRPDLG